MTAPGRFRLLAFDLDGTLLGSDGRLAAPVRRLLEDCRRRGIRCVCATGRRRFSALPILAEAGVEGPAIVQNGAVVCEAPDGRIRRACRLEEGVVRAVVAGVREHGVAPVVYQEVAAGPREVLLQRGLPDPSGYLEQYRRHARGHLSEVDDLLAVELCEVVRVTAHHRVEEPLRRLGEVLCQGIPGLRAFVGLDPVHRVRRLEVLRADADKGTALCLVCDALAVPAGAVLAVGDDANDVEMLRRAGHSVAAPGATPAAREAARETVSAGPARGDDGALVAVLRRHLGLEGDAA